MEQKNTLYLPLDTSGRQPGTLCLFHRYLENMLITKDGIDNDVLENFNEIRRTICLLTRLDALYWALSQAIETLATQDPALLRSIAPSHWYRRYTGSDSAIKVPRSEEGMLSLAIELESDIYLLLSAVQESEMQKYKKGTEITAIERFFYDQFDIYRKNKAHLTQTSFVPKNCAHCMFAEKSLGTC